MLLSAKYDDKKHLNTWKKMLVHLPLLHRCVISNHWLLLCHCYDVEGINWPQGDSDNKECISETALNVILNLVTFVKDLFFFFFLITFLVSMYYSKIHAFDFRNCQRKLIILPQLLNVLHVLCIQCQIKKSVYAKFIYAKSWKRFIC